MKDYPLEVEELRGFKGGHMGYWSKGHHEALTFLISTAQWAMDNGRRAVYINFPASLPYVRHEWWRFVPAGPDMPRTSTSVIATPGTRGAFPVTVWED